MKRFAAAARAALSDPVIIGMAGLYLLTRALAALDAQARATTERLGEVQAAAAATLQEAQAMAAQVDGAVRAAHQPQAANVADVAGEREDLHP